MTRCNRVLIFHPAAIGDAVLATPVAATLKGNFPDARISYLTHASLLPLLKLCPSIDELSPYDKRTPFWQQVSHMRSFKADLVVDLSGSPRSLLLTTLCGGRVVRYKKQPYSERPIQHAVENFLDTLKPLSLTTIDRKFPSLTIPLDLERNLQERIAGGNGYVCLVPGVGALRSHRAWPAQSWVELGRMILETGSNVALCGGSEDIPTCSGIAEQLEKVLEARRPSPYLVRCLDFAGQLSLPETAALLKGSLAVVSADTGPAHVAVASGAQVVGITGPTFRERSGPYGMAEFGIERSNDCRCQLLKECAVTGIAGPGQCMQQVPPEEVFAKLKLALAKSALSEKS